MPGRNNSGISRRTALAVLGGGVLAGGGGYALLDRGQFGDGEDAETHLLFVRLINAIDARQSFEVALARNDEAVLEETYHDVPAYGTERKNPDAQNPSTHMTDPTWDEGPAAFDLRARSLTEDERATWSSEEADADYVGIDLYFWERAPSPSVYAFETETERETAREFVETELNRQADRDSYGSEP